MQIKKAYLQEVWGSLDYYERFAFNKLITGGFRIGISQKLMTRALSQATGIEEDILAYRLMGNWSPETTNFKRLILEKDSGEAFSRPYPFFLAYPLENETKDLGAVEDWGIEYKWDGIRAQLIFRNNDVFLWSRGEELITEGYPEFQSLAGQLPYGTVLDGELLPLPGGHIGTFNDLQKRLGRKKVGAKMLQEIPVILKAYDLLEWEGKDIRDQSFGARRAQLEAFFDQYVLGEKPLLLSELIEPKSWAEVKSFRLQAREKQSEGLMLKHKDSTYGVGRKKGAWWKWKVEPLTIDAVLTYAMRGHGRRSNLFTDYTFGLWHKGELVTFAKAYSGLTDAEFNEVDDFIKKNTLDRFGPVRQVKPKLVFEIAFEGLAKSSRHKSGIAVRFPRILRWRKDKQIEDANTLEDLNGLIL